MDQCSGTTYPPTPRSLLSHLYPHLKRDPLVLTRFTERVGQEEDVIHADTKGEEWQHLEPSRKAAMRAALRASASSQKGDVVEASCWQTPYPSLPPTHDPSRGPHSKLWKGNL